MFCNPRIIHPRSSLPPLWTDIIGPNKIIPKILAQGSSPASYPLVSLVRGEITSVYRDGSLRLRNIKLYIAV